MSTTNPIITDASPATQGQPAPRALGQSAQLIAHNGEPIGSDGRIELWQKPGHGQFVRWADGAILSEDRIGFGEAAEYCTCLS